MCGIIAVNSKREISKLLLSILNFLEYRGYDSSGIAIINSLNKKIKRLRCVGRVKNLKKIFFMNPFEGKIGIAHTRWASHGNPTEKNAHPHISENIAVVHNGTIDNYLEIKKKLINDNYKFFSDTDTEIIAHLINLEYKKNKNRNLYEIVNSAIKKLKGIYSIVVMDEYNPKVLVAANLGSPIVVGLSNKENFFSSDPMVISSFTKKVIYLKQGDVSEITSSSVRIWNKFGMLINRKENKLKSFSSYITKYPYKYYMEKEIFDQPKSIENTLNHFCKNNLVDFSKLNKNIELIFKNVSHISIVACGSSYHSALVSKYWFEEISKLQCNVEIASEFKNKMPIVKSNTMLILISQSGETADILSVLRKSKKLKYLCILSVCNTYYSTLVRESDISLITKAGIEISVASTKTFTVQLIVLLLLSLYINSSCKLEKKIIKILYKLPSIIKNILNLKKNIKKLSFCLFNVKNLIIIGTGKLYPIAMEAALKIKEISYIHAESCFAGELKHGVLSLIDKNIPVIALATKKQLKNVVSLSLEQILSRNGLVYLFSDVNKFKNVKHFLLPDLGDIVSPILYVIPMQLLSYYMAVYKKIDLDHPRNLAKSVTVS
ncbi:MAG: glutamine--fructose-6-phosphate transaminase (isomerizing) [Enterobacteriaceae bacterium]